MSSSRKRYTGLLLALLMALGLVATAAPAAVASQYDASSVSASNIVDSGVVLFRGRAKIGKDGWNGSCDWDDGTGQATGGLHFPNVAGNGTTEQCYKFSAPKDLNATQTDTPFCFFAGIVGTNPTLLECQIEADGVLKGALGFSEPHCGVSSSNDGNGTALLRDAPDKDDMTAVDLSNLGWITSAGSLLPVTGSWDGGKGKRKLVVLVQALGNNKSAESLATACQNQKGAGSFDVNAVGVLLPVENALLEPVFGDKCGNGGILPNLLKHSKKDC